MTKGHPEFKYSLAGVVTGYFVCTPLQYRDLILCIYNVDMHLAFNVCPIIREREF
jgi:hypothetical protein